MLKKQLNLQYNKADSFKWYDSHIDQLFKIILFLENQNGIIYF